MLPDCIKEIEDNYFLVVGDMTQEKGCTYLTRFAGTLTLICWFATSLSSVHGSDDKSSQQVAKVHTVITGGCNKSFDWQVLGLAYRFVIWHLALSWHALDF